VKHTKEDSSIPASVTPDVVRKEVEIIVNTEKAKEKATEEEVLARASKKVIVEEVAATNHNKGKFTTNDKLAATVAMSSAEPNTLEGAVHKGLQRNQRVRFLLQVGEVSLWGLISLSRVGWMKGPDVSQYDMWSFLISST
jgi:hypothetical protein